jgi:hypothetical protein
MLLPGAADPFDPHQAERVWFGLRWGMNAFQKTCFFFLFTPVVLAAPVSDTVNERIPVTAAELEVHWQVDCSEVSGLLRAATRGSEAGEVCAIGSIMHRQLELCVFIYQPPGSNTDHVCPDYRGALSVIDQARSGAGCYELGEFLRTQPDCSRALPRD